MSSLQVSVQFITGVAFAGTSGPAFAAVSVTDPDGVPILDLQRMNFKFSVIVTTGGVPEPMAHALNTPRDDGFYMFSIFKGTGRPTELWFAGEYLAGVQLQNVAAGHGQALGVLQVRPRPVSALAPGGEANLAALEPATVDRGWQGVLGVQGSNFAASSFAVIDGRVPPTRFKSDSLLEVDVDTDITGTAGRKAVRVYAGDGGVSDEQAWTVTEGDVHE